MCCNVLQCVAVCCSAAVCCSVLQCVAVFECLNCAILLMLTLSTNVSPWWRERERVCVCVYVCIICVCMCVCACVSVPRWLSSWKQFVKCSETNKHHIMRQDEGLEIQWKRFQNF